tara:strand:- start:1306 stop:1977 length:672 start_codon:yes stop_codon:yes gene_type:complete
MPSDEILNDSPATLLFPQFESELYRTAASEVAGLTAEQLDFESDKWGWSEWSIRRQLSHLASGNFRWFWQRWGLEMFPSGPQPNPPSPEETKAMTQSKYDRRMDEDLYWEVEMILEKLLEGLALGQLILSNETAGSLRTKEFEFSDNGEWPWFYNVHTGLRRDTEVQTKIWFTLETIFRHRYFEHITHLYNIQRIKLAQGLATSVEVPIEGYMALPGWDLSTP